ncbi:MAG: YciI family protein [Terriglobales bacterium]|jgi:uncharacterized protein YciI
MKFLVLCRLKKNGDGPRKALRLKHLEYIQMHKASILASGPALDEANAPSMMILFVQFTDKQAVEDFIQHEPYTASGQVIESVEVHRWAQVLPEPVPGSLGREIEKERTSTPA